MGYYQTQPIDDFLNSLNQLKEQLRPGIDLTFYPDRNRGMVRARLSKKGYNPNDPESRGGEPAWFDLAPGPLVPQQRVAGQNEYAIRLLHQASGSSYSHLITSELMLRPGNVVETSTPMESLQKYIEDTVEDPLWFGSSLQQSWERNITRGGRRTVGALLQTGNVHSQWTVGEMASRVNLGFDPGIGDKSAALQMLQGLIRQGGYSANVMDPFIASLRGAVPVKGDEFGTRFRYLNATPLEQMYDDLGVPRVNQFLLGVLGKDAGGAIKHANINYSERERIFGGMYTQDPANNWALSRVAPGLITTGTETGFNMLNVELTGNKPEPVQIIRGAAVTPGTPFPGAMLQYGDPLAQAGIVGPFQEKNVPMNLHIPTIEALRNARFQFGVMEQKVEEGKTTYFPVSSLKNVGVAPGESITYGFYQLWNQKTKSYSDQIPLTFRADSRGYIFKENPTLIVPPAVSNVTGEGMPAEDVSMGWTGLGKDVMAAIRAQIRKGGGSVSFTGMNDIQLALRMDMQVGKSFKSFGLKASEQPMFEATGQPLDRLVDLGRGSNALINAVTSEIKNPLAQFEAGVFGTLTTGKQTQLLGELFPEARAEFGTYGAQISALQAKALAKKTAEARARNWEAMNIEEMTNIYNQATGSQLSRWQFSSEMMSRFLAQAQREPERTRTEYQYAEQRKSVQVPLGLVHNEQIPFFQERLQMAIAAAVKEEKITPEFAKYVEQNEYTFSPVKGTPFSYFSMKSPFKFQTLASTYVPEHLWKDPGLGKEELATLNANFPEEAAAIGAAWGMRGLKGTIPPARKAWSTIHNFYTYQFGGTESPVTAEISNTVTEDQMRTIRSELSQYDRNSLTLEAITAAMKTAGVDSKLGILKNPMSGEMIPTSDVIGTASLVEETGEGETIPISAMAKIYPRAFSSWLEGGSYMESSGSMAKLQRYIGNVMESKSGNVLKTLGTINPPGAQGGRFIGSAVTGLNTGIIGQKQLERMIMANAEAQGVSSGITRRKKWMEEQVDILEKAGGMSGFFMTMPSYGGEAALPMKLVTPTMLRKQGLNIPEVAEMENGTILRGGTSMWGLLGAFGPDVESIFRDLDLDPGIAFSPLKFDKRGNVIPGAFKKLESALGLKGDAWLQMRKQALEKVVGNNWSFSGYFKSAQDISAPWSWNEEERSKWFANQRLEKISMDELFGAGVGWLGMKAGMGTSFNARRAMEDAAGSLGTFSPEFFDEMHSRGGRSYATFLEMDPDFVPRSLDSFINTLTPIVVKGGDKETPMLWSKNFMSGVNRKEFDINAISEDLINVFNKDVEAGLMNPEFAIFGFSRNQEEYAKNVARLGKKESLTDILTSMVSTGGDMLERPAGLMTMAGIANKIFGITRDPYKIKTKGEHQGQPVGMVMGNMDITVAGQTTKVKNLLENDAIWGALKRYQVDVRAGPLMVEEQARMHGILQARTGQVGLYPDPIGQFISGTMNIAQAARAMGGEQIKRGYRKDLDFGKGWAPTASQLTELVGRGEYFASTARDIVAKHVFGINMRDVDVAGTEFMKPYTEAGDRFEASMWQEATQQMGLTDVTHLSVASKKLESKSTRFGQLSGTPDILGIDPKTGQLVIADLKWSDTEKRDREKQEGYYKPQLVGYGSIIEALAEGRENFVKSVSPALLPAGDESEAAKTEAVRKAGLYYDAFKDKGARLSVVTGMTNKDITDRETFRFTGRNGVETTYGAYIPSEADTMARTLQESREEIFSVPGVRGVASTVQSIATKQQTWDAINREQQNYLWHVSGLQAHMPEMQMPTGGTPAGRSPVADRVNLPVGLQARGGTGNAPVISGQANTLTSEDLLRFVQGIIAQGGGVGGGGGWPRGGGGGASGGRGSRLDILQAAIWNEGVAALQNYRPSGLTYELANQLMETGREQNRVIGGKFRPEIDSHGNQTWRDITTGRYIAAHERDKTDAQGHPVLDSNGNPIRIKGVSGELIKNIEGTFTELQNIDRNKADIFVSSNLSRAETVRTQSEKMVQAYRLYEHNSAVRAWAPKEESTVLGIATDAKNNIPVTQDTTLARLITDTSKLALGPERGTLPSADKLSNELMTMTQEYVKSVKGIIDVNHKEIEIKKKNLDTPEAAEYKRALSGRKAAITEFTDIMDKYGGIVARPQGRTTEEKMLAYGAIDEAGAAVEKAEKELLSAEEKVGPGQMTKKLRKVFGGFGLFYMGTLLSMGTKAWGANYRAVDEWQQEVSAANISAYGQESGISPYISPEIALRKQQLAGGSSMMNFIRNTSSNIAGGPFEDIGGAALTGIGAGLLTQHVLTGFGVEGAAATSAVPWVALAVGTTALAGTIATKAQDREALVKTIVQRSTAPGFFNRVGEVWNKGIAAFADNASYNNYVRGVLKDAGFKNTWMMDNEALGMMVYNHPELFPAGSIEKNVYTIDEETTKYNKMIGEIQEGKAVTGAENLTSQEKAMLTEMLSTSVAIPEFEGLAPETLQKVLTPLIAGGELSEEDLKKKAAILGNAIQSGQPTMELAQTILSLTKGGYSSGHDIAEFALQYAERPTSEQNRLLTGATFISNIPGGERTIFGLSGTQLDNILTKYGGIPGPYQQLATQRLAANNALYNLGVTGITFNPDKYANTSTWSDADIAREQYEISRSQRIANIGQSLIAQGGNSYATQNLINQLYASGNIGQIRLGERAVNFSPTAIGELAMQPGANPLLSQFAVTDFNLQGKMTGLGLFTTSLNQGQIGAVQSANNIWGTGNWENTRIGQAMTYGINTRTGEIYGSQAAAQAAMTGGANVVGGTRAAKYEDLYASIGIQQQQLGVQWAQIALQEQYRPLFYSLEDRQRALGYRQQEWSFSQQAESLAMQTRQTQEQWGLQQRQIGMQRGWTMEDWAYQDQTRALQWGWKQEDYAEQTRFMTGRQRRLAERQMERDTTMFNMEGDRIQTMRERQKEMWALEDERFEMQKRQYMEQKEFQENALKKQREFYEENKKLTEENVKLNREYQEKQLELQKASLALQQQAADMQNERALKMLEFSDYQDDVLAKFKLWVEEQTKLTNLILQAMNALLQAGGQGGMGGGAYLEAEGGDIRPGSRYVVGERRPEMLRSGIMGSIVNQYDLVAAMNETDSWSSKSVFYPYNNSTGGGSGQTINVYVGNEKLASFVVNTVKRDLEVL